MNIDHEQRLKFRAGCDLIEQTLAANTFHVDRLESSDRRLVILATRGTTNLVIVSKARPAPGPAELVSVFKHLPGALTPADFTEALKTL